MAKEIVLELSTWKLSGFTLFWIIMIYSMFAVEEQLSRYVVRLASRIWLASWKLFPAFLALFFIILFGMYLSKLNSSCITK